MMDKRHFPIYKWLTFGMIPINRALLWGWTQTENMESSNKKDSCIVW